jgi:hypothetical protein
MDNPILTRDALIELLSHNVITVKFVKVDGTLRSMTCTLLPEYLPSAVTSNGKILLTESEGRTPNLNVLSVWDIDSNAWKSFRVNSVSGVTIGQ